MGRKHGIRQRINNAYLWGENIGKDKVSLMLINEQETKDKEKF